MRKKNVLNNKRIVRHFRIRKKVRGTQERPRLSVYPSLKHMEAQFVDDFEQRTLLGLSTKAKEFHKSASTKGGSNVKDAAQFGKYVAQKAKDKGILKVVFDRGGFLYHGRIKAFCDSAREGGLSF